MYITKNQQHEETQHADKLNTMNNIHNKKSTTCGNTTCRQRKHNECT